jgi:rhodanese-related sulfurtransferase
MEEAPESRVVASVTPRELRAMLLDGEEIALVDVREELIFSQAHLLHARSVPLSRLELRFARLVPRRSTRIVLCDAADGLAERAAAVLTAAGYGDVRILQGGVAAWRAAGYELFSGVNVPSKAFGEFVEHKDGTPNVSAEELNRLLNVSSDLVVLDSRPFDEFSRMSIPTATNVPGAELVLRVQELAPSPETLVVVNCAGRTRSIIGAQSLINAGLPNKVVALRNGTMGWALAGFATDSASDRTVPDVSEAGLATARERAAAVRQRFHIPQIDMATLERFRAEAERRSLYILDVRDPPEYAAGHVAGAVSAPGGQLVQATDQYVGTRGARLVLVDDKEVRAVMTASWLRQMGWDTSVLVASGSETGWPHAPVLGHPAPAECGLGPEALAALLAKGAATVIDLSFSRSYRRCHIPGAWFAIRSRLARALEKIPRIGTLVLTCEDGALAQLAVADVEALVDSPVRFLDGGNAAWRASGRLLTADDPRIADEAVDLWLKPYEREAAGADAMQEYLDWETDLLPRIARDGTAGFIRFD